MPEVEEKQKNMPSAIFFCLSIAALLACAQGNPPYLDEIGDRLWSSNVAVMVGAGF